MANALAFYPHVRAFCKHKAPECVNYLNELEKRISENLSREEARKAETSILEHRETFVVYAYSEIIHNVKMLSNYGLKAFFIWNTKFEI